MKLGRRRNYHKGRAAIRHYANQPEPSDSLPFKLYSVPSRPPVFPVLVRDAVLWWMSLDCMFLTFICSPPRAALSRDRAKNAHKKRRDGGAWRHYNTHNSYNTCWWYKNFQGRSARLSAQQQPTTVQIVVAVGPQQHRIQSTIDNKPSDLLNPDDAQYNCNYRL